jgi:hypothetical protein
VRYLRKPPFLKRWRRQTVRAFRIDNFSAAEGGNKGIDIAGTRGQSVVATASGRVVYAVELLVVLLTVGGAVTTGAVVDATFAPFEGSSLLQMLHRQQLQWLPHRQRSAAQPIALRR